MKMFCLGLVLLGFLGLPARAATHEAWLREAMHEVADAVQNELAPGMVRRCLALARKIDDQGPAVGLSPVLAIALKTASISCMQTALTENDAADHFQDVCREVDKSLQQANASEDAQIREYGEKIDALKKVIGCDKPSPAVVPETAAPESVAPETVAPVIDSSETMIEVMVKIQSFQDNINRALILEEQNPSKMVEDCQGIYTSLAMGLSRQGMPDEDAEFLLGQAASCVGRGMLHGVPAPAMLLTDRCAVWRAVRSHFMKVHFLGGAHANRVVESINAMNGNMVADQC